MESNKKIPKALVEYRALPSEEKLGYVADGKPGAASVRELQDALRRIENFSAIPKFNRDKSSIETLVGKKISYSIPRDLDKRLFKIALGPKDEMIARATSREAYPRKRNWISPEPSIYACKKGEVNEYDIQYKGKYKGYSGSEFAPKIRSAGRISRDKSILTVLIGYATEEKRYTLQAGRGYQWGHDDLGVLLCKKSKTYSYHPTSDEMRAGRSEIVKKLNELEKKDSERRKSEATTQRAKARKIKRDNLMIRNAIKDNLLVTLDDSLRAGNCEAGTKAFATNNRIDYSTPQPVKNLIGKGEDHRVLLAIAFAAKRATTQNRTNI